MSSYARALMLRFLGIHLSRPVLLRVPHAKVANGARPSEGSGGGHVCEAGAMRTEVRRQIVTTSRKNLAGHSAKNS